jgi:glycosyltransferase involved in cell wall biosynthesis
MALQRGSALVVGVPAATGTNQPSYSPSRVHGFTNGGGFAVRIAQVAPLAEAVPPLLYGGTERVVAYLTEALVAIGHDVTLFASGDSETEAKLVPAAPHALRLEPGDHDTLAPHVRLVQLVLRKSAEFDIVHFHIDHLHLPVFASAGVPYLTTMHGRLDLPELPALFRTFPDAPLVSISNAQRRPLPEANFIGTVHHGLPADLLRRCSTWVWGKRKSDEG